MGAGRKPKPTALRKLEGNPGKRPFNDKEPQPSKGTTCPSWLLPDAKTEWKRIAKILTDIGLLTAADRVALAGYCQSYAKWKSAEKFLEEHGDTYSIKKFDKDGEEVGEYVQQYPQVTIALSNLKQIKAFCTEFGLTPSSRSRLQLPSEPPKSDFGDLLD